MTTQDQTVFSVPDMSCGHCEATIRRALASEVPGAEVAVDLASHKVTVKGDAGRAEHAIRDAGYSPQRLGA